MNKKETKMNSKKERKKPQYVIHVRIDAGGDNLILDLTCPDVKTRRFVMQLIREFFERVLPQAFSRSCSD